jgi:hypothetical protein
MIGSVQILVGSGTVFVGCDRIRRIPWLRIPAESSRKFPVTSWSFSVGSLSEMNETSCRNVERNPVAKNSPEQKPNRPEPTDYKWPGNLFWFHLVVNQSTLAHLLLTDYSSYNIVAAQHGVLVLHLHMQLVLIYNVNTHYLSLQLTNPPQVLKH